MASSTATSAAMDLTQVIPSLLDGIAQALGLEPKEFKIVYEDQIDPRPFQDLHRQHYHDLEWDFKRFNAWQNPEPYLEIQLENENLHPHTKSQQSIANDVKGSNQFTDGSCPVSLYQVGSYGSCLSALRPKMSCAMEGNFQSKGAPRTGEIKHFQAGGPCQSASLQEVPRLASPCRDLPSHSQFHTWHMKYPKSGEQNSLEFDIKYTGIAGIALNLRHSSSISGIARLIGAPASQM